MEISKRIKVKCILSVEVDQVIRYVEGQTYTAYEINSPYFRNMLWIGHDEYTSPMLVVLQTRAFSLTKNVGMKFSRYFTTIDAHRQKMISELLNDEQI